MTTTEHTESTGNTAVLDSVTRVPAEEWDDLAGPADIDLRHAYLRFREHLEPGASVAVVDRDRHTGRLLAAMPGTLTTDRTALFSHPWKLLTSDQVLRGESPQETAERRARRSELLAPLIGPAEAAGGRTEWQRLTEALGAAFVVRGYDSSEIIARAGAEGDGAVSRLLDRARRFAAEGGAGAVVLPYVREDDDLLRGRLRAAGFRRATLTGASDIRTGGAASIEDFLAALPGQRRYRYRSKMRAFAAGGHTAGELSSAEPGAMESVVAMELSTMTRHGSGGDPAVLGEARAFLAEHAGDLLRIPVAADEAGAFACGVHLVGRDSYLVLTFGSDYRHGEEDSRNAYHHVTYHDPVAYCCSHGLERVRLGFEAFHPKVLHSATVRTRETWYWLPDADRLDQLASALDYVSGLCLAYLARYTERSG